MIKIAEILSLQLEFKSRWRDSFSAFTSRANQNEVVNYFGRIFLPLCAPVFDFTDFLTCFSTRAPSAQPFFCTEREAAARLRAR